MIDVTTPDPAGETPSDPARAESAAKSAALAEIEDQLAELVGRIRSDARDAAVAIDPALQPFGLKVLGMIVSRGPLQSSAIATALFVDRSVISRQVTQLCELGLVELQHDAVDGRVRRIAATPLARERLLDVRGSDWSISSRLESWSASDIRSATRLLARLTERR
jgi:DNA-binding MarR family transcriptional regulator